MDARIDEVLEFWFGPGPSPTTEIFQRWFRRIRPSTTRSGAGSARCTPRRSRAGSRTGAATRAASSRCSSCSISSRETCIRDDPRAFAVDHEALAIARELRRAGRAKELGFHEQLVALLPFEHAEDRATQTESVAAFDALVAEAMELRAGDDVIGMLRGAADYARQHKVIVDRFGRFPHRNATLGRDSTPAELAFLQQPGSGF